jgi:hypothetical protein
MGGIEGTSGTDHPYISQLCRQAGLEHRNKEGLLVKTFGTQWERIRFELTPSRFRFGLALLSLVAMVFAGAAGEHWD